MHNIVVWNMFRHLVRFFEGVGSGVAPCERGFDVMVVFGFVDRCSG